MTDDSQTGAGTTKVDALKPKKKARVATWNAHTLYQTEKLAQVVNVFDRYRLDFHGITEDRWLGFNRQFYSQEIL